MPTEFEVLNDDEKFPFLPADDARGVRFSRFGLIDAADQLKALTHPSVPKIGDKYEDGSFIFVRSRRVVSTFGGRVGSTQGATFKLEIVYETPTWSGAGALRAAKPGDVWTEVTSANETLTVYRDVGIEFPPGAPRKPPINGGDGASVDVGSLEASVKVWYDRGGFSNVSIARLIQMNQGGTNRDAVVLPNLIGSGINLNFGPGQVRYRCFAFLRDGDFYGVEHKLVLAQDHLLRTFIKDVDGMFGNEFTTHQLYQALDFSGLWD